MTAGRMTRRSLLAAGAAALTGALDRPEGVLAALASPARPVLRDLRVGRLAPAGRTIVLGHSADLIGLQWQVPAHARVELRFRGPDGRWSGWLAAGVTGHGPDRVPRSGAFVGEPLWTGGTRELQLRASRALSGLRVHLIDVSGGSGAHRVALAADRSALGRLAQAAALPRAEPVLQAGPGQPPIIARRAWARGMAHPRVAPEYGAVQLTFVHHTENPNGYLPGEVLAMLRAIFTFHRYVHGWNDIGYNFVIDTFGRIFEARAGGVDEPVVGAHAGGYNLVSSGVAVLGSFMSRPISPAARGALQRLLAWKLALHSVPAEGQVTVMVNPAGSVYSRFPANARVSLPRIAGHRDGDTTDCPGDVLYRELPAIRPSVLRLAGRPVRATLALSSPGAGEAAQPGASSALAGALAFLDGAPVSGASIQLQQRSVVRRGEVVREQTIAQVLSDGEGRWSLPVSLMPAARGGISLRALYAGASAGAGGVAGAGAAVSEPLFLAASALSPAAVPAPTPPAPPAPAP